MPDFVLQANISHYKELLAKEADPEKIAILRGLLAKEEAKLTAWQANNPKPPEK